MGPRRGLEKGRGGKREVKGRALGVGKEKKKERKRQEKKRKTGEREK